MWRTAFSPSTFTTVTVVVVVVVAVTSGTASDNTSSSMSDLTQEITMSLVVNQLAILKGMNESSSLCASRDRDFQLWKEAAKQQLQATEDRLRGMAEDAQARMHNMTEETRNSLRGMAEDAQSTMQAVKEAVEARQQAVEKTVQAQQRAMETMKAVQAQHPEMKEKVQAQQRAMEAMEVRQQAMEMALQTQQRTMEETMQAKQRVTEAMGVRQRALEAAIQVRLWEMEETVHLQQRTLEAVEAVQAKMQNNVNILLQVAKQALHNDTEPSLCHPEGTTKVLHGSRGTLYVGRSDDDCSWRVVLPEGTRPFIYYESPEENCGGCSCGWMSVSEVRDGGEEHWLGYLCNGQLPHEHPVNSARTNQFIAEIVNTRREHGVSLHYQAVPISTNEVRNNSVSLQ